MTDAQEQAAGSAAARTVALAAEILRALVTGPPRSDDAAGLTTQAESLRQRAIGLTEENRVAYGHALTALSASRDQPGHHDHRIGEAMRGTLATLLQISDAAADVAELAVEVGSVAPNGRVADAAGAAALAEGSARVVTTLIAINLVELPEGTEIREAELNLEAATRARERVTARCDKS